MSKLIIDLNNEYKVKIENANKFEHSIFKNVYRNAAKNLSEIIKQSNVDSKYDEYNNIIAFTGERGKGKSSSMISFMNSLLNLNISNSSAEDHFFKKEIQEPILKKRFGTIDVIDPSLFRGKESLFEIILAKMFSKFQEAIKAQNYTLADDDKRKIITHFQTVFNNLRIIKGDRSSLFQQETIEALSNLATSSNLKKGFQLLVDDYLKEFLGKDFLVIAIDDFDLNISGAYDMLEDIRQFLIQKKIIILISCRLEQLRDALINHYDKEFKNPHEDNANKASRYLDKLIPFSRRCELPQLIEFKNKTFEIIDRDGLTIFNNEEQDIQRVIIQLLYKNHNFFLSDSKYRFNSIVPKTLRELQEFFNIIAEKNQLENLKRYLLAAIKKEDVYPEIFEEIDSRNEHNLNLLVVLKIKQLARLLLNTGGMPISSLVADQAIIKEISDGTNPDNISTGDVYAFIKNFESFIPFDNKKNNQFLDYLKIYYSIRNQEQSYLDKENLMGGVYNGAFRLFRADGRKRRDWVEFNYSLKDINDELKNIEDKFAFSLFIQITGKNYRSYRRDFSSPFFRSDFQFENGVISPISFLSNSIFGSQNFKTLNQDESESPEILRRVAQWAQNNILLKQFNNVMFLDEFLEQINAYIVDYKSKLPSEYFDIISFYLVNAVISAIKEISNKYDFVGNELLTTYINHPIVQSLAKYNRDKGILVIDESLFSFDTIESFISPDLVLVVNKLYLSHNPEKNENLEREIKILEKLELLNSRIRKNPEFKIQTLSTIINEIEKIDTNSTHVDRLIAFKPAINSKVPEDVEKAKKDLKQYIEGVLNGQS